MTGRLCLALFLLIAMSADSQVSKPATRRSGPAATGTARNAPKPKVAKDLDVELAKWKPYRMPAPTGLSAREQKMLGYLVQAQQEINNIFWRQSDPAGLALLKRLRVSKDAQDQKIVRMLSINGSRYDLLEENKPFVGDDPFAPGRALLPVGMTREQIEQYVKDHPDQKDALYSPFTVVRRNAGGLEAVPYHVAFRAQLEPAAQALREAAALSDDAAFARYLKLRADALLNDDYYASDIAWMELQDPKFDIIYAPYETYLDDLLGVKTSYGGSVLIRNDAESKKLALYQQYVPDIQDALPIAAEDKPSKRGHLTPMEVMDAPFRSGDLRYGYQAVADNLPNDPRIHQEKGSKKIFFKNFMDARVNVVILPIAKRLMREDQAPKATGDGYLTSTIMHEIAHGLGPAFARQNGKQVDIREAIGPAYSGLEEAKADIVGLFGLKWLVDKGALPKERLEEYYASEVAGIFRTVRFGIAEAHGRAEMMEFNFFSEQGAIQRRADGRYEIDFAKMPVAIEALAKELLEIEATGDRARAEAWFSKYDKMPQELATSLKTVSDVPVDIEPIFPYAEKVQ